jgi:Domain of unknown function (DUF4349)
MRVLAGRRRVLGAAGISGVILILAATAAGCSGAPSSSSAASSSAQLGMAAPAAAPTATGAPANGFAAGSGASGQPASTAKIAPGGQQLIETAQLSVRAKNVGDAIARATQIVTAAGGYVSAENASAGEGNPSQATATVTFKIPVAEYQATLAALSGSGLGTQLSLSQQAQDVTQQVADVNSRVTSAQAAITQLRALLAHAGSVSELLSVQNQINDEEANLESMLAQQSALSHQTSYATVTLNLAGPKAVAKVRPQQAPPGLNGGLARGWHAFRVTLSWLLTVIGAVAPFAAALAVIGGLGWWARRRLTRGRRRPASTAAASPGGASTGGDGA